MPRPHRARATENADQHGATFVATVFIEVSVVLSADECIRFRPAAWVLGTPVG
jgi:hypothetical protein